MNISIILPVYNAARFLEKAVDSALQFPEVKEVILIEDCSPDNSLEICYRLIEKDNRVKLFQHPDKGNHGAGASRNLGLEKASQEFIAFLDADDYYLPNRFDAEKELFNEENIEGVFGAIGIEFLNEEAKKEFQNKFKNLELTTVKRACSGREIFSALIGLDSTIGTFFHLNGLTIRNETILKNKLKFNEILRVHQDSDFIVKLSYACHLQSGIIDKAIAIRGVHEDNRITKIENYSEKFNQRQLLLWRSINNWSIDKKLSSEEKNQIYLKRKSFELASKKGFSKYLDLLLSILKNPQILKTRYRFTYLNNQK